MPLDRDGKPEVLGRLDPVDAIALGQLRSGCRTDSRAGSPWLLASPRRPQGIEPGLEGSVQDRQLGPVELDRQVVDASAATAASRCSTVCMVAPLRRRAGAPFGGADPVGPGRDRGDAARSIRAEDDALPRRCRAADRPW